MINTTIQGPDNGVRVKVTDRGELVVGNLNYADAYNAPALLVNVAYNLISPQAGKQFVITDIMIYANKNVGINDASISIYEATGPTITTVSKSLFITEIKQSSTRDISGLNPILTRPGYWINCKTDDNDVFFTLCGYYVDTI